MEIRKLLPRMGMLGDSLDVQDCKINKQDEHSTTIREEFVNFCPVELIFVPEGEVITTEQSLNIPQQLTAEV